MYDRRMNRADRAAEQEQAAWEEAFARHEAAMIAEYHAEGGDDANYKPRYAQVHALVTKELDQRRKQ